MENTDNGTRIRCSANECIYHEKDGRCTAKQICISTQTDCACANCSTDTLCSTFRPQA